MNDPTELQTVRLEKQAILFWLNLMVRSEWMATASKIAYFEATIFDLKNELFDVPSEATPEDWDAEVTARFPIMERYGRQLIDALKNETNDLEVG